MNIDRSRFLKLAVALAATTSVATTACSSAPAEDEGSDSTGALVQTAGGACTAKSIKSPGAGSMSFYAYEEGFCGNLAYHAGEPDEHGVTFRWFDFINDQCRAYSQQFQPAVAKQARDCLAKANDARPRDANGDPTVEFDAQVMWDCGHDALYSICSDGIDGRVAARAERIALLLKHNHDPRALSTIQAEVGAVLSGLKSAAREEVEKCVANGAYDLYTCVEGISIGFTQDFGEPAPSPAEACAEVNSVPVPPARSCDAVLAKIDRESAAGEYAERSFAQDQCNMYMRNFEPAAAQATLKCLTDPSQKTYQNIYSCGAEGLKKVCRDPAGVDSLCKEIVDSMTAIDPEANAGGRVTRQCRTLMPGLRAAAREQVKQCAPGLTRALGSEYAFYSCVEGLE